MPGTTWHHDYTLNCETLSDKLSELRFAASISSDTLDAFSFTSRALREMSQVFWASSLFETATSFIVLTIFCIEASNSSDVAEKSVTKSCIAAESLKYCSPIPTMAL